MIRLQKTWSDGLVFDEISASTDGLSINATLFAVANGNAIDNDPGGLVAVSVGDEAILEAEVFLVGDADNYLTSDWECDDDADSTVAPGGTLDILIADAGNTITCTVTNTLVFFEGIPVLNRYGLALLALLMLGIGVIGFRRFS